MMPINSGYIGKMDISSIKKLTEEMRKLLVAFARHCIVWKNDRYTHLHERETASYRDLLSHPIAVVLS